MGINVSKVDFEIIVKTGDVKGGGTDSNVYCKLEDQTGTESHEIKLNCAWKDDFEKGSVDVFPITNIRHLKQFHKITIWRDSAGVADDWYLEYVKIQEYKRSRKVTPFPINRWLEPQKKLEVLKYDSVLPQQDARKEQRKQELKLNKKKYKFQEEITGYPRMVANVPIEEEFSNDYMWDIIQEIAKQKLDKGLQDLFTNHDKWNSFEDLSEIYTNTFGIPYGYYEWRSDDRFGQQRLRGVNPIMIKLCKTIPKKLAITSDMVEPFLEGMKLDDALKANKIYITDLVELDGLTSSRDNQYVTSPIALFYATQKSRLIPIAIQLYQKPSKENPVFLPSDPPNKWLLAKMFYNNADAAIHESCTHLGFTHLICESICVSMHLTLSPSHPVFRLLMPHFIYLLQINKLGVTNLLKEDGVIDNIMTLGANGSKELIKRKTKTWRLDRDGWLPGDLEHRGVDNTKVLPKYYYRDDALLVHEAILDYVTEVLNNVYANPSDLEEDVEIKAWGELLIDPVKGPGIQGVFGNGDFSILDNLIKTCACTIFIASVSHGAVNFGQYDEYGFPPFYPGLLTGMPPTNKNDITEEELLCYLPDKQTTLETMTTTHLLSMQALKKLGDFEVEYQFDPKSLLAVQNFRGALAKISGKIQLRNAGRRHPYPYLDPERLPNAISI